MSNEESKGTSDLADVKQLGLFAAIASLSYVFWIVGGMEMVERLAYYGVKAVAVLYAKDPVSKGGLGINLTDFGTILLVWALIQSLLPVFTGGLSDRYGYKETIFVSTVVKIMGYLVMAFFPTYWGFFGGAVLLATGTAIFKPGIQGTLVKSTTRENSSMAWGIFYQTVNIGGFMGPLVAGLMRKMAWQNVFFACAAIICLNFLLLLTYKEVGKDERLERNRKVKDGELEQESLWRESLRELAKTHVWLYLLIFSGFWFMFNALFDVLPAHIDDWVNSADIVSAFFGDGGTDNAFIKFFVVMNEDGTRIEPEGMLNLNAGLIMTTCFLFAYFSGRMRATTSMFVGTLMATAALFLSGYATAGWAMVFAIGTFSVGEMLSSPKFSEFIGNFAPDDKKAMYLGFSQIPLAIGWTLEAQIGPWLYDVFASKDQFSRDLVADTGRELASEQVPQGEAFDYATNYLSANPEVVGSYTGEAGEKFSAAIAENAATIAEQVPSAAEIPGLMSAKIEAAVAAVPGDGLTGVVETVNSGLSSLSVPVDLSAQAAQYESAVEAIPGDGLTGVVETLKTTFENVNFDLASHAADKFVLEHASQISGFLPGNEEIHQALLANGDAITEYLYATHSVATMWNIMGVVGIVSAIGIFWYGKWVLRLVHTNELPKADKLNK
jgi:dipeptide/tripeptide permease